MISNKGIIEDIGLTCDARCYLPITKIVRVACQRNVVRKRVRRPRNKSANQLTYRIAVDFEKLSTEWGRT